MISIEVELEKYGIMGEKTGWHFLAIPAAVAHNIKPDFKRSFRVKGLIDALPIHGVALIPVGEGDFIFVVNNTLRRKLHKEIGDVIHLQLEEDIDFKFIMPEDLEIVLNEDYKWMERFLAQAKSHQNYYIKWLDTAKTAPTREKRLTMICLAMENNFTFGEMIRHESNKNK